MFSAYSGLTMDMVQDALQPSADSISSQMQDMMTSIENNPDPSPADMTIFQANMQVYMTLIEMNSSITENMGSMMKQIAQNIGN